MENTFFDSMKIELEACKKQMALMQAQMEKMKRDLEFWKGLVAQKQQEEQSRNHDLLKRNQKILVLGGTEVKRNDLEGIVKNFGYDKADVEFVSDFDKIKKYAGRVQYNPSYAAIIVGPAPHKTEGLEGYNSIVERFEGEGYPLTVKATNSRGQLQLSKHSFKVAMKQVSEALSFGRAGEQVQKGDEAYVWCIG